MSDAFVIPIPATVKYVATLSKVKHDDVLVVCRSVFALQRPGYL